MFMEKKPLPNKTVSFIAYFLQPYTFFVGAIVFITFLWAANRAIEPYIIKVILDTLEKTPLKKGNLFNELLVPISAYIFVHILVSLVSRFHDYIYFKFIPVFHKNIVIKLTKYLQKHSQSYFQHHFGGSLVSKISTIGENCKALLDDAIYNFIFPFFSLLIIAFTMASVHKMLGIVLALWTVIFIAVSYYLSLQLHRLSEQLTEKSTKLIGKIMDSITNILAVRLFGRRKFEIKFLDTYAQEKVEKEQEIGWKNLKLNTAMDIMANLLIVILLSYLIHERQEGRVSIGDFALIFTLTISIIDTVWDISRHYMRFVKNLGSCSQALKTILVPHAIKDLPNVQPLNVTKGRIEFKNIYYGPVEGKPIFQNLSLTIKAGEKVGIVGQSGSGKTTLLNLLVRLMDVDKGSILIDGQNIKEVTQDSLHKNISFIPQEPMLFHRTILENIKYGNLEAPEEEIYAAASQAFAETFIKSLPEGYNTLVGERGSTLSGGQRQRLAIARSILKNAKILILDEATSALDSETEYYIQQSLENLMKNKTVLVVAHRLSTLLKMDRIIVLEGGKIVEQGDHASLLAQQGRYSKLWNIQASKGTL
jgi:ATP-binding cassette subfamily B protein